MNPESKEVIERYKEKWRSIALSTIEVAPKGKELLSLRRKADSLFRTIYRISKQPYPRRILIVPSTLHADVAVDLFSKSDFESFTDLQLEKKLAKEFKSRLKKEWKNSSSPPNFQGRINVEWFSYMDWFINEYDSKKYLTSEQIEETVARQEIIKTFLFWAPYEECIICVLPPKKICIDDRNRWHNRTGYAFESVDPDVKFVAIENHLFKQHVALNPSSISIEEIKEEQNVERRRILREQLGEEVYLQKVGAKVLHADSIPIDSVNPKGHFILRALMEDALGEKFLVANDGSTGRIYIMQVDPESKTCADAHESMCRHIPGFKDKDVGLNA